MSNDFGQLDPGKVAQAGSLISSIPTPITSAIGVGLQVLGTLGGMYQAKQAEKISQQQIQQAIQQQILENEKKKRYMLYGGIGLAGVVGLFLVVRLRNKHRR
jgi:hypothetical protein